MVEFSFGDLMSVIQKADQLTATSLAHFSRANVIQSPMYISEQLHEEPALKNIVSNVYNIYIGYILNSLRLNKKVSGSKTVRDILATVSTDLMSSQESLVFKDSEMLSSALSGSVEVQQKHITPKDLKIDLPVGKVIELKLDYEHKSQNKQGEDVTEDKSITIPLTVRLNPRLVPEDVINLIIDTEFKESRSNRWLRVKAGEISFIKDFIFQMDQLDKRAKALKRDKGNALADIHRHKNRSHMRFLLKLASMKAGMTQQQNLACSVFIFDADQVQRISKKKNINLFKVNDRRRFFAHTFSLFCILVDTNYSKVHIMTNGIDDIATYTFNELKGSNQDDDIKDFLDAFQRNQLPKF